jgi:hypothetical protein
VRLEHLREQRRRAHGMGEDARSKRQR